MLPGVGAGTAVDEADRRVPDDGTAEDGVDAGLEAAVLDAEDAADAAADECDAVDEAEDVQATSAAHDAHAIATRSTAARMRAA